MRHILLEVLAEQLAFVLPVLPDRRGGALQVRNLHPAPPLRGDALP